MARSPLIACVASSASGEGAQRSGAIASAISNSTPVTYRFALTLPSRYFAATSGRAGVRRGSSIALAQEFVDRPRGLAFAALGAPRFGRRRPGENIDMQPAFRKLHEALQEQRAGDRAREGAGCRIVDIGDFRIEPAVVRRPERQSPQRVVLAFRAKGQFARQLLIVGVKRRQIGA